MPDVSVVPEKIQELSTAVEGRVLTTLSEATEILPRLREIDQDLYTSVSPGLAVAYTAGVSYMYTAVRGAGECFGEMSQALSDTADQWKSTDELIANGGQMSEDIEPEGSGATPDGAPPSPGGDQGTEPAPLEPAA